MIANGLAPVLYASVLEQIPGISLLVCDRSRTIIIAHGEALREYGYEPGAIIGQKLSQVFTNGIYYRLESLSEAAFAGASKETTFDTRLTGRGYFRVLSSPLEVDGEVMAAMIFSQDITEVINANDVLARQNRELQEAKEKLEQFALMIAHDFRSPLRIIIGFSQLMVEAVEKMYQHDVPHEDLDALSDWADRVIKSTKTLSGKVDATLSFSRLGQAGLEKTTFSLSDVLRKMLDFLDAKGREIAIKGDLPRLHADQELTELVFQNLIENAIKYTPEEGGEISIYSDGDSVYVKDNGQGIDPAYHDRIFDLFFKMKDPQGKGHGVGLAMVKRIVDKHGGSISVLSTPGEGTTFKVSL